MTKKATKEQAPKATGEGKALYEQFWGDESSDMRIDRPFYSAQCTDPITGVLLGFEWGTVNRKEVDPKTGKTEVTKARVPHAIISLIAPVGCEMDDGIDEAQPGEQIAMIWGGGLKKLAAQFVLHGPIVVGGMERGEKQKIEGGWSVQKWKAQRIQPLGATKIPDDIKGELRKISAVLVENWAKSAETISAKAKLAAGEKLGAEGEDDGLPF